MPLPAGPASSPTDTTVPDDGAAAPHRRIVVGFDGSPGSYAALRWAVREAHRRGTSLQVVSAWGASGSDHLDVTRPDEDAEVAAERVQMALKTILLEKPRPEHVSSITPQGPPGPALLDAATGAELLIIGTTGLEAKQTPGPVSLYCLHHSRIPVVFVPNVWGETSD
jgi:nucleotide-binding universal stress UspA family protein